MQLYHCCLDLSIRGKCLPLVLDCGYHQVGLSFQVYKLLLDRPPWTLGMAQRLQTVMDGTKSDSTCCNYPRPEWQILTVSCSTCAKVLDKIPRPDLGRKRMDGFFAGGFRLLLTDGYPTVSDYEDGLENLRVLKNS